MTTTLASILAWHDHHDGWGPGPWWPLLWILFWGAVVGGFLWWRRRHPSRRDAAAVLAERYAQGAISDEEYRQRRAVLSERAG
ncbi:MAG: SHOCT domain-containing protein [Acidimicrobiia bacterium]